MQDALVQAIKAKPAIQNARSQEIGIRIIYPGKLLFLWKCCYMCLHADDPGFETAIHHYIPNDIPESVDLVVEPGSEFDMSVLVKRFPWVGAYF